MHRDKTGEGQIVEGSLLGTALTFNNAALVEQAVLGLQREGSGTRGQYNAPTDTFQTIDGWISVQIVGGGLFKRVCTLLEKPEWLEEERFDSSIDEITKEVLGLTKMNWNNTQLDGRMPITIECAQSVGEIIKYVDPSEKPQVSYSYYM